MTWAVTASVAFWFGTNSVADMRDAPCSASRCGAGGLRRAGPSRGDRRRRSRRAPSRAARSCTSPISAATAQPGAATSAASASSAASGATKATSTPSLATYIGSMPRISQAPATAGRTGTAASRTTIATPEACASSFSTEATPPRVASRRQRSDGPAASSSASTAGHSERVSDSTGASSSNSPRASMIAVPCSPIGPETRIRSPGRSEPVESAARGSTRPSPVVRTYIESQRPRSTTLVSPATISTPAAGGGGCDRLDLGAQVVGREALLEHERERQRERARAGHREVVDGAVDGELADRAAGEADRLDDEAVGGHARGPSITPASPSSRSASPPKAGTKSPSRASASPCRRRRAPS